MSNKTHICAACHTNQGQGDGYCYNCGTQLEAVRYCNSCGVEAAPRSKFCRECGEVLPAITKARSAGAAPPRAQPPQSLNPPQPVWLNEPTPARAEPKPAWLREPEPAPPPVANISPPAIAGAAPLAPRPQAAPVPISGAPLATPHEINPTRLAIASVLGLVATLALLNGGFVFAIVAFIIMLNVGGASLSHVTANGLNKIIDTMWESPAMRRRLLGE